MGDNSRCSDEHWEPKKWERWPAFLCVGKETSYAHRQWNHSPTQILLSHICLRTQSPLHWSNWEFFHLGSGRPGVGSAAAGHGTGCAGGGTRQQEMSPPYIRSTHKKVAGGTWSTSPTALYFLCCPPFISLTDHIYRPRLVALLSLGGRYRLL